MVRRGRTLPQPGGPAGAARAAPRLRATAGLARVEWNRSRALRTRAWLRTVSQPKEAATGGQQSLGVFDGARKAPSRGLPRRRPRPRKRDRGRVRGCRLVARRGYEHRRPCPARSRLTRRKAKSSSWRSNGRSNRDRERHVDLEELLAMYAADDLRRSWRHLAMAGTLPPFSCAPETGMGRWHAAAMVSVRDSSRAAHSVDMSLPIRGCCGRCCARARLGLASGRRLRAGQGRRCSYPRWLRACILEHDHDHAFRGRGLRRGSRGLERFRGRRSNTPRLCWPPVAASLGWGDGPQPGAPCARRAICSFDSGRGGSGRSRGAARAAPPGPPG